MRKSVLFLFAFFSLATHAQDKKEAPKFGISFSGFVKTDIFYDTRQTVNIREGHFLLYPENESPDANGRDVNAKSSLNILSIQSRLKGAISGPDAFKAKTSGVIEADFFGNENSSFSDLNGLRLRHAFVKMNWKSTELLVGQYWHPMFVAESFPGVISFNTGAPFQPFSRNPQIRLTKSLGDLKFIGTVYSQRDFTSIGPEYKYENNLYSSTAVASSKYLRNSGVPNLHFQFQFNPDSSEHLFGAGIDFKSLLPESYSVNYNKTAKFQSSEKINCLSGFVFAKLNFKPIAVRLEGIYAQNAYDMVMIGGYVVEQVDDSLTGAKSFANLNTASVWLDFNTKGKKFQFGMFAGYTRNLGTKNNIKLDSYYKKEVYYARGSNIDNVYRVAPRVVFISGKLEIALEIEHTVATYGRANGDGKGGVTDGNAVSNTRGLLAFIYKF
jgi:hypothetical protein